MDLPLYTTVSRSELSDLGSVNYHQFDHAIILDQVMRQAGNNDTQQQFRDILMRLRNGELSVEDWKHLMKQTLAETEDASHSMMHFVYSPPLLPCQSIMLPSCMPMVNLWP